MRLLLVPSLLFSLAISPMYGVESDPLDLALANMEDVLARLDQQATSPAVVADRARAAEQLQLAATAQRQSHDPKVEPAEAISTLTTEAPQAILARVLKEAGLSEGDNGPERGNAYVSVGSAVVAIEPGKKGYAAARILAYHQAELLARTVIARNLASTISSERMSKLEGATGDWDALLRSEGIDPATADETQRLKTLENVVRRRTAQQASAALSGCITFAVAEGPGPSTAQEIHVAILWSPALAGFAKALQNEDAAAAPATKVVGAPISEQLPATPSTLLRSFGVQPMIDENGQRVLVAFGQAAIEGHSNPTIAAMRANHAYDAAQMEAAALLKEFIYTETNSSASSELQVLTSALSDGEGNSETTSSSIERFRQSIKQASSEMTLRGLRPLSRWRETINGAEVAGVIMLWSPATQQDSRAFEKALAPTPSPKQEKPKTPDTKDSEENPARGEEKSGHGNVPGAGSW